MLDHVRSHRLAVVVTAATMLLTLLPTPSGAAAALPTPGERFASATAARAWQVGTLHPARRTALDVTRSWNGSTASCRPGTRTTTEINAVVALVNVHRDAASVPKLLGSDASSNDMAQAAALIMEANGALSHDPPSSWACWTTTGHRGAGASNLALGFSLSGQVTGYIDDGNVASVGHRQWLLTPEIARIGVGATSRAGAIRVIGAPASGTTTARAIPWPPAGHTPAGLLPSRWSLSFHNTSADLSGARATVKVNGTSTTVTMRGATSGFGDLKTMVFDLPGSVITAARAAGSGSTRFDVTVTGVKNGTTSTTYRYATIVARDRFDDDDGHLFEGDILTLAAGGITTGCSKTGTKFCPDSAITRGQMAAFFVRALNLPRASRDHYRDDESSIFEDDINRFADAGITRGCGDAAARTFCPEGTVTREQMAQFFVRALKLRSTTKDWFTDDEASPFEDAINRLATAGVTTGCGTRIFCPKGPVTRGQMAAFFVRADLA